MLPRLRANLARIQLLERSSRWLADGQAARRLTSPAGGREAVKRLDRLDRLPHTGEHASRSPPRGAFSPRVLVVWPCDRPATGTPRRRRSPPRSHVLSEPPGTFDTDNLISNEASYLDVVPALSTARFERRRLHRGRTRSELHLHRADPSDGGLHHRHPARQPAPAPAVQGALRRGAHASRVSLAPDRPRSLAGIGAGRTRAWTKSSKHIDRSTPWPDAVDALGRASTGPSSRSACRCRRPTSARSIDSTGRSSPKASTWCSRVMAGLSATIRRPRYPTFRELLLAEDPHGRQAELPGLGGGLPVRQGPAGPGRDRSGRRRRQRPAGAQVRRRRDRARVTNACRPSTSPTSSSISTRD